MSMSLLKKSMAIVEEDLSDHKKLKEKAAAKKKKGIHKRDRPTNDFVAKNVNKKTIQEIRDEMDAKVTKADENVKKLLALTKHKVKIPNPEKILKRVHTGKYVVNVKKPVEQESLFTEEDFAAFEEELAKTV